MAVRARVSFQGFLYTQSPFIRFSRNVHAESPQPDAVYPPILPSRTAKSHAAKSRRIVEFFDRLRAASVEDKIRALTCVQRKKYVIYPQTFALNADQWYQHFTKTAYLPGLPEKLSSTTEAETESANAEQSTSLVTDDPSLSDVRSLVCNAILQEHWYKKKSRTILYKEQQQVVAPFLTNVVSGVTNILAKQNPLLRTSSLDFDPQVNFYWLRGQRTIPRGHRSGRVEPVRFQIDDRPHSQIRVLNQLPEYVPLEAEISAEVPVIRYSPDVLPAFRRQYDNNIFTGAKIADPCQYGHTQFHFVPDKFRRDKMGKKKLSDQVEVYLRANGIASLFAWTGAQAMYQGFWSQEDLTRPFVSQAVITDGQYFSFFCYQLNTLALTSQCEADNTRKNLCWGTESMRLYESITDSNVIGLNDDVLRLLVQFLLNKP
ncbi:large ribosomal subunit protein mL65 [Chanos chanos]|uniref:Large ribosomal subunit protein mL65 n=1 Tax=Chanos chanos TaxID=29144 RepID=A0A6J2WTV4_CHACN|nr:39S ribosomal protein S30, mitochondrial [Chanos chanos]